MWKKQLKLKNVFDGLLANLQRAEYINNYLAIVL